MLPAVSFVAAIEPYQFHVVAMKGDKLSVFEVNSVQTRSGQNMPFHPLLREVIKDGAFGALLLGATIQQTKSTI